MKLDIRRKVLLLVLSGSLVTFFSLAAFLLYGIYNARTVMHEQSEALSEVKRIKSGTHSVDDNEDDD